MKDDTPLETGEGDALPYRTTDHPPCTGINCGITRVDQQHSKECIAETALAQGWTDGAGVDLQVFAQVVLASASKPAQTTTENALGLLKALEKHVDEYLAGYELCGDSGNYTPNDTERLLIADAIHGLLADDEFITLFEAWRTDANAFRALLVPPPGLTFGKVGKKMSFSIGTQSFVLDFEPEEPGEFEFMEQCLRRALAAIGDQPVHPERWDDSTLQTIVDAISHQPPTALEAARAVVAFRDQMWRHLAQIENPAIQGTTDLDRDGFEQRVFTQRFIASVTRNPSPPPGTGALDLISVDCPTKAELCARDDKDDYLDPAVSAMWWGWKESRAARARPSAAQEKVNG